MPRRSSSGEVDGELGFAGADGPHDNNNFFLLVIIFAVTVLVLVLVLVLATNGGGAHVGPKP